MTGADLVADVLRILSVLSDSEAPSSDQVQQHMDTLNEMMAEWQAMGRELGYTPLASSTDLITVPDWALRGMKYNLALQLSLEYARPTDERIVALASAGMATISKMTSEDPIIDTMDLPQGRRNTYFNINTGI